VPGFEEVAFENSGVDSTSSAYMRGVRHANGGVEHAFMNSVLMCFASPCFIILFVILLAWNEKRAVCDAKAILKGKTLVKELGCSEAGKENGELVMFSCHVSQEGQKKKIGGPSGFANSLYTGVCLKSMSQMLQCVESVREETVVVGNRTGIKKTYTYTREYKSNWVDSSRFHAAARESESFKGCSRRRKQQNPAWPVDVPVATTTHATSLKMGSFAVAGRFVPKLACDKAVPFSSVPAPWKKAPAPGWWYERGDPQFILHGKLVPSLGHTRLGYSTNSWQASDTLYTVLGKNAAGKITDWTAPSSWLCDGYKLGNIHKGKMSKDELFKSMEATNTGSTWFMRIFCYLALWASFCCLFGPLEVAADFVPYIGRNCNSCE